MQFIYHLSPVCSPFSQGPEVKSKPVMDVWLLLLHCGVSNNPADCTAVVLAWLLEFVMSDLRAEKVIYPFKLHLDGGSDQFFEIYI